MTILNNFAVTIESERVLSKAEKDFLASKMEQALIDLLLGDALIGQSANGEQLLRGAFEDVQIEVRAKKSERAR